MVMTASEFRPPIYWAAEHDWLNRAVPLDVCGVFIDRRSSPPPPDQHQRILELMANEGLSAARIAARVGLRENTVKYRIEEIRARMGSIGVVAGPNRAGLVGAAFRLGWLR